MTTDDVVRTVKAFHLKRKHWPSMSDLLAALVAEGFSVDDHDLNDLLLTLFESGTLHPNNGTIEA